jgi:MinD superfamily P-loop ATPase
VAEDSGEHGEAVKIAVASGKGGTGKTTVATSLALSLKADLGQMPPASSPPLFLDCDVEAPNAHLFLKPALEERREVGILIPYVDEEGCSHCGTCAQVCQYHAITVLGHKTLVFPQLCHGCGSCTLMCPENAISETLDVLGILERGFTPTGIDFAHGVLNVGEPMAVPIIRQLKKWADPQPEQVVLLDAPPGTSCPVVETLRGADFILLVTEPTPFGLHDLKLAVEVTRELGIPVGIIVNRDHDHSYPPLEDFCNAERLPVLLRIPFDRAIAEGVARGKTLVEICPDYNSKFRQMYQEISFLDPFRGTYKRTLKSNEAVGDIEW